MNADTFKQEYELVLELPENEFITYFNRDDKEFLNDFLFTYFKKSQNANPQFIGKLLNANAQLLLETIRLQQVPFLYPIHWDVIKKIIPPTHNLINWIDVLDFVKNQEILAWQQFTEAAEECLNVAPIDVRIFLSW